MIETQPTIFVYSRGRELKITIRKCVICGVDFRVIGRSHTCSLACRSEYRKAADARKIRMALRGPKRFFCEVCNTEFSRCDPKSKFCSKDCKRISHNRRALVRSRRRQGYVNVINCIECGTAFDRSGRTKTCGEECKHVRNLRIAASRRERVRTIHANCQICGSEFTKTAAQKFCSPACVEVRKQQYTRYYRRSENYKKHKQLYMKRKRLDPLYRRKKQEQKNRTRKRKIVAYKALTELGISCTKSTAYHALKELGVQI